MIIIFYNFKVLNYNFSIFKRRSKSVAFQNPNQHHVCMNVDSKALKLHFTSIWIYNFKEHNIRLVNFNLICVYTNDTRNFVK